MNTERLYVKKPYQKEGEAVIITAVEEDGKLLVTLDQTIFFPTGGGQSCDVGKLGGFDVVNVFEKDNSIYHQLDAHGIPAPIPGSSLSMKLDWKRRFDNMQRHCGEHILSGAFDRLFGGVNRGFHMGDDYITIDIRFEKNPKYTKLNWDMAKQAEVEANRIVNEDLPITVDHYDTKAEAEEAHVRKEIGFDEDITIVTVGDKKRPADCVACCGTHPSSSGQVGLIKIYKIEKRRDLWRVYFEAGARAFKIYQEQYDILTALGHSLSAGNEDILSKFEKQEKKWEETQDRLHALTGKLIEGEIEDIKNDLALEQDGKGHRFVIYEYEHLSGDEIMHIGKGIQESATYPVPLVSSSMNAVFLFSDGTISCNTLVKTYADKFNGKGGGTAGFARVSFDDKNDIHDFLLTIRRSMNK